MKKLYFLLAVFSVALIGLTSCSEDKVDSGGKDKVNKVLKDNPYYHLVEKVNTSWGESREQVISNQNGDFNLKKETDSYVVYSINVDGDDEAYLSYMFDKDKKLCAATLIFHENEKTTKASDGIYLKFDGDEYLEDGIEYKKSEDCSILSIDRSSTVNGQTMITVGFSYYVPCEVRDDCVDLGLSVQWATTNLGANTPTGVGRFYSWSETSTKSSYWISNYAFSNDNKYPNVYDYTNPLTNICGSRYDVATQQLGEGWKMPSLAEANELIEQCTWEKIEEDGVDAYKVTGPNGNSIIIPHIAYNYQDKGYTYRKGCYLATGECVSKTSEGCYVITVTRNGNNYAGDIDTQWKCWGYNIRPVYVN